LQSEAKMASTAVQRRPRGLRGVFKPATRANSVNLLV
jgi:hypothetical protein